MNSNRTDTPLGLLILKHSTQQIATMSDCVAHKNANSMLRFFKFRIFLNVTVVTVKIAFNLRKYAQNVRCCLSYLSIRAIFENNGFAK